MKNINMLLQKICFIFLFIIKTTFVNSMVNFNQPPQPKPVVPIALNFPILNGSIMIPRVWDQCPEFRIFFEGKQTVSDKEGLYSFPLENRDITKLYILLCKEIETKFASINTIKNINIRPEKSYKFFSLKKNHPSDAEWKITEKKMDKKKFVIPQNCLIFLMNPKYVAQIENWNLKAPDNMIKFPQIVLKDGFDEKKVKREADKSIIRSWDFNAFHENVCATTKKDAKPKVNLTLTQAAS